jgi:hypothetical protein
LIPVLYLVTIYLQQPDYRLSGPEGEPPARHRLLYDDYDATAYALRGLNAWFGRPAGRLQEPTPYYPQDFAVLLQTTSTIAHERTPFFLEYPPVTLWLFEIPFFLPPVLNPSSVSQALADGWHTNVVEHDPQAGLERFIWRKLRFAARTYEAIGIGALMALMLVVRRGYGELPLRHQKGEVHATGSWTAILLLLPASLYFSANRFDVLPALLVACSLAALGRDRPALSACLLAVATLVKLYPVFIAAVVVAALSRHADQLRRWFVAYLATAILVSAATIPQTGWAGWWTPYWYQLNRTTDSYDASFYGVLWPAGLAGNQAGKAFRLVAVLAALVPVVLSRPQYMDDILRYSAAVLIVLVSVQTFYSPQWILWLAPLLLALGRRQPIIAASYGLMDAITYLTFPVVSDWPMSTARAYCLDSLVWARAILLCTLLVALVGAQWRSRTRMTTETDASG